MRVVAQNLLLHHQSRDLHQQDLNFEADNQANLTVNLAGPVYPLSSIEEQVNLLCPSKNEPVCAVMNGGMCYNNDVFTKTSYLFNTIYQMTGKCDFGGITFITTIDLSAETCKFQPLITSGTPPAADICTTSKVGLWLGISSLTLSIGASVAVWKVYQIQQTQINVQNLQMVNIPGSLE